MKTNAKLGIILLIILLSGFVKPLSAEKHTISISGAKSGVELRNNHEYGFDLNFQVGAFSLESLNAKGAEYQALRVEGYGSSGRIGEAELPVNSRIFAVPLDASVEYKILNLEKQSISTQTSGLSKELIPVQPPVSKSADYASLIFEKDEKFYSRKTMSENPVFGLEELGILRGLRLFQFYYEPIRYNPANGELEVITNAEIKVEFQNPDFIATEALLAKTASAEFEALYSKVIFNWPENRASLVRQPTKMVILCPPAYLNTMTPYITVKRKQGYIVDLVSVGSGGTISNSTSAIKSYMQNLWNSATTQNPAPTYLLIVGDHGSTGNNIISNSAESSGSHITDLSYVRLNGTDFLPEMYYGRFSVSSTTELNNIINKTLMFAETSMPDKSYLGKTVMIAGVDANYATTHGNGAINYATTHYINAAHGITSNNYLYPASGSSAAQIRANAAEGRAYMNYTAHGGYTSWADPSFTAAQMTALTNVNKPFVAVGNCCITNAFDQSVPCFGEAIIRAPNAGAAYIGGTNNTYWNEDYYWAVGYKTPQSAAHAYDASKLGVFDAMFHAPTSTADWASTTGETVFMGNMAVQQSSTSLKNYYWEIYSIMGDPSLMPYYGVPTVNNVSFPQNLLMGNTSMTVSAAAYTRVGLTMNGTYLASGIVPASGSLNLSFPALDTPGNLDLVFTASGKITRQESVQVLPATGAYLNVESLEYRDSNNNLPDYNENGSFNVNFKNIGTATATNITATLSSNSPGITITNATASIASLVAGASVNKTGAFSITIANNIQDQSIAEFSITMQSGTNSWTHDFYLEINAPALSFGEATINDAGGNNNGYLDPGETVTISIPIHNTGGAASPSGTASLNCNHPDITIHSGTTNFGAVAANGSRTLNFGISAANSISIGSLVNLSFTANAGAYSAQKAENHSIGLIIEDFESGTFNSFPWELEGNQLWTVVSSESYQGQYSAKSGTINHSQSSTLKTNRILTSAGTLSFWYKVSSEANYDKLNFYINDNLKESYSGTVDWTEASFELEPGTNELKWTYAKDYSQSSGSDCAWLDNITFPASTAPSIYNPPRNLSGAPAHRQINLMWEAPVSGVPTSYKIFRDQSQIAIVNALSYLDQGLINGTLYSYYVKAVYADGESDPSNFLSLEAGVPNTVVIGNESQISGTNEGAPINIWYKSLHGQSIYTAQELLQAGVPGATQVTQIGFYVEDAPEYPLTNFMVRMKHSTDSNVSSWQTSSGMNTYYQRSSYMPVAGGFDMLLLDTPFEWNGTDNIVIDTAFGLIPNYSSSGRVQYSSVSNGYRFVRSDNQAQAAVFTGGSSSNNRPNVKFMFNVEIPDDDVFSVNPESFDFGELMVGESASQTITITNHTDARIRLRITSPDGYSIMPVSRDEALGNTDRNTVTLFVMADSQRELNLNFAPLEAGNYDGELEIYYDTDDTTVLLPVSGSAYLPPIIQVNTTQIACSLELGEMGTDSFRISNIGGEELSYQISVHTTRSTETLAAKQHNIQSNHQAFEPGSREIDWLSLDNLSGNLAAGESRLFNAVFNASGLGAGDYSAQIQILSNDPFDPEIDINANLEVIDHTNYPPELNLPESFSFDKNGSLIIDVAVYASDPNNDPLSLQISGDPDSDIYYEIQGMSVVFSARQNWVGSDIFTFTVSDGELYASMDVLIQVLPVNEPDWQPVNYPTNPATIYCTVSVNGAPAKLNDKVAAFVGTECRGVADVMVNQGQAFATLIVQLEYESETVYFKVFSFENDMVYDAMQWVQPGFGEELGVDAPIQIEAGILSYLESPVPEILLCHSGVMIFWQPILHADFYEIYAASAPNGEYSRVYLTADTSCVLPPDADRLFFKVKAVKGMPSR